MIPQGQRNVGFIIGGVVLVGALLGAYFVVRAPQTKPRGRVPDAQTKTISIPIEGMTCASCVAHVKQRLKSIEGVSEVEVSLEHRNVRVRYVDAQVSEERLAAAINDLGYKAGTSITEKTQ